MLTPTMFEPMPYEGRVVQDWINAAKQNSAFLNDRNVEPFSREMFRADLKKTADYAERTVNRAVAAQIREESRRFFGDDVNNW